MKLRTSFVMVLLTVACGASEQPARQPDVTTTGASNANQASPTETVSVVGTAFSDAQIAAITDAANNGEVEQAKLAFRRAKDPQVKAFAQLMLDHHGGAIKDQHAMMMTLNLAPEPTQLSGQLSSDSQNALSSLSAQVGGDFDKAYIDLQVKEHKDVLDALDTKLIPSAHNADFKKVLSDFRPKVQDHLRRAEDLQQILAKR